MFDRYLYSTSLYGRKLQYSLCDRVQCSTTGKFYPRIIKFVRNPVLQEDPAPAIDKKTVLYQEQVARTRSGILEIFLGKRKNASKNLPAKNTKAPSLKPSSSDSSSVIQSSDCSAVTDI